MLELGVFREARIVIVDTVRSLAYANHRRKDT
jgi:hypothetical protein